MHEADNTAKAVRINAKTCQVAEKTGDGVAAGCPDAAQK
jgi:hypothetical protein